MGVEGIEAPMWGQHFCMFFNDKDELLKLTVPFIKAGLEDHEYCLWITGDPLTERSAFHALEAVVPHAREYLATKQLEILSHTQWYLSSGRFDGQTVLENWAVKAAHAETQGFAGLRITGNPVWLDNENDWRSFRAFEELVHQRIRNERAIALCTYPLALCEGEHIMQTLETHSSALTLVNGRWRQLELSG